MMGWVVDDLYDQWKVGLELRVRKLYREKSDIAELEEPARLKRNFDQVIVGLESPRKELLSYNRDLLPPAEVSLRFEDRCSRPSWLESLLDRNMVNRWQESQCKLKELCQQEAEKWRKTSIPLLDYKLDDNVLKTVIFLVWNNGPLEVTLTRVADIYESSWDGYLLKVDIIAGSSSPQILFPRMGWSTSLDPTKSRLVLGDEAQVFLPQS